MNMTIIGRWNMTIHLMGEGSGGLRKMGSGLNIFKFYIPMGN